MEGNIRCTGCRYQDFIEHSPVRLDYVMSDGQILYGYREFAWCFNCNEITDAEEPFNSEHIQRQLNALPGFRRTLLRTLLKIQDPNSRLRSDLEQKLELSRLRKAGARCLKCCETTVFSLTFDKAGLSNVLHHCGGRLYEMPEEDDSDAPDICYGLRVIKLDVEGHQLGEEVL